MDPSSSKRPVQQVPADGMQRMKLKTSTATFCVYLCTWNVGGADPPQDFTNLLNLKAPNLADIYGIGLQEMSTTDSDTVKNAWTSKLLDVLGVRGYILLRAVRMSGISLQVFVKRNKLLNFTNIETEQTKAGLGGWWGNKGGVSVRFDLNGVNMIIVNCHLAAHMTNVAERIEDFNMILDTQKFRDEDVDNILDHDYVFWMGDLNFRIADKRREEVEKYVKTGKFQTLLMFDQLNESRKEELLFVDFEEGQINLLLLTNLISKQRIPAWCDRILSLIHEDSFEDITLSMEQLHYDSHPVYTLSDHKPVTSAWNFEVFSLPPHPAITFHLKGRWYRNQSCSVNYTMVANADPASSSWDWIGLYKSTFKHIMDYETYIYANRGAERKGKAGMTVKFSESSLTIPSGKYYLCYISKHKNKLMGMSEEFELV
ncbi:hypothetical protein ScPMuIL_006188 [Solemya velum]